MARDPQSATLLHLHHCMFSFTKTIIGKLLTLAAFFCCGQFVHSQSVAALIATGDSLLALDKPQRALDYYEKAIANEKSATTYMARARSYYALDRLSQFLPDVEKALRMDSAFAEAHYYRALYSFRADDLGTAEYHATKALAHANDETLRTKTLLLRGETRAEMKRIAPAIADLEAGIARDDNDLEVMRTLARLYDASGNHEQALAVLVTLCIKDSTEVGHWSNRAFELIQLERNAEALVMVEKALDIDKDEPVALSNRAYIYYTMDRFKEATHDVERSLRFYPANPYALRTRALLRLKKGDREKACDDLTLAKALGEIPEVNKLAKEHCAAEGSQR